MKKNYRYIECIEVEGMYDKEYPEYVGHLLLEFFIRR